jgi:hypothetical protein
MCVGRGESALECSGSQSWRVMTATQLVPSDCRCDVGDHVRCCRSWQTINRRQRVWCGWARSRSGASELHPSRSRHVQRSIADRAAKRRHRPRRHGRGRDSGLAWCRYRPAWARH